MDVGVLLFCYAEVSPCPQFASSWFGSPAVFPSGAFASDSCGGNAQEKFFLFDRSVFRPILHLTCLVRRRGKERTARAHSANAHMVWHLVVWNVLGPCRPGVERSWSIRLFCQRALERLPACLYQQSRGNRWIAQSVRQEALYGRDWKYRWNFEYGREVPVKPAATALQWKKKTLFAVCRGQGFPISWKWCRWTEPALESVAQTWAINQRSRLVY